MKSVSILLSMVCISVQMVSAADSGWESTVAAGANVTSGNSDTLALNGSVSAEKVGDVHEVRLGLDANYGESEVNGVKDTTTDNSKATVAYKYKFNRSYLYSDNSLFRDDIAAVDYRLIAGVGAGYRLLDGENAKLGLELGAAYVDEKLTDGSTDNNISARVAVRHDQKLNDDSKLWLSAEYLPNTDDAADYLLNGEAGAEAALNSTLSLRVVVQDRYDSSVPVDREYNDLSVISSLVYKL